MNTRKLYLALNVVRAILPVWNFTTPKLVKKISWFLIPLSAKDFQETKYLLR